ncbi:MAG: CRISPR system precrRNA processing endoribonuclease RAMP protein Cas6 [Bacteroidetes bacterium]|nr:CRISPR system precrRNA processing endoribonuclease RAMP protein Cas6 [Bacteroidota bacterium]
MHCLENDSFPKLQEQLQQLLDKVTVSAWRLLLRTPHTHATTPMIRGVWGRALRHLDRSLYDQIFAGSNQHGHNLPRYIVRPAPPDPNTAPALDWILFNVDQIHERTLWKAWEMACVMGLGSNREPFRIRRRKSLTPDNRLTGWNSWTLGDAKWPLPGDPAFVPCLLRFDVPVRLIKRGQLITSPGFTDLITASLRRIAGLAGMPRSAVYRDLMRAARSVANQTSAQPWVGEQCNLVRWSAAQQREVKLFGVTGAVSLVNGPSFLWPLLAAAQWCHLGKGTVFGMGQTHILPYQRLNA